nr:DUF3265 domain-containing protein [Vibrio alfacsensis]
MVKVVYGSFGIACFTP